jgi:hypothetical protein
MGARVPAIYLIRVGTRREDAPLSPPYGIGLFAYSGSRIDWLSPVLPSTDIRQI